MKGVTISGAPRLKSTRLTRQNPWEAMLSEAFWRVCFRGDGMIGRDGAEDEIRVLLAEAVAPCESSRKVSARYGER